MKVFKHLRSDWFRYGFETLAVIVGILIAFALENWQDTLQIKKEEHEILLNLHSDLLQAKQQSSELINGELKSFNFLLSALNSNRDPLPEEFFSDSIFYQVLWDVDMDIPVITAYSEIKNTGKPGLITNEKIRQSLTNLELGIMHLGTQVDDRLKVQQLRIDALLVNDLNFVRMIKTTIPEFQIEGEPENNYRLLLEDQKIRNLVAIKSSLTKVVIRYREELDAEIQSLISLLEAEIECF
jgi:hypothetical protein